MQSGYIEENNVIAGIRVYRNTTYLTVPRWRPGVPATLNTLAASGRLTPYPSWEMQEVGNCSTIQYVQSMEIDPLRAEMWVVDVGRVNVYSITEPTSNKCPPKVVILDLNNNGAVVETYSFPNSSAPHTSSFLNDIVIDLERQVAFISDAGIGGVTVYDRVAKRSWRFTDATMGVDPSFNFTIAGVAYGPLFRAPTDGIALHPDRSRLLYTSLQGTALWSVDARVLGNPRSTTAEIQATEKFLGHKPSASDGMVFDCAGKLYFGNLGASALYEWQYSEHVGVESATPVQKSTQTLQWVDTVAFDEHGRLYGTANKLQRFGSRTMDFTGASGPNMYVHRFDVAAPMGYILGPCGGAPAWTAPPPAQPPPSPPPPIGHLAATIEWPNNVGESIEYDALHGRLVIGSLSSGRLIGLPLPNGTAATQQSLEVLFGGQSASADVFSTSGLQADDANPCYMYAAVGGYPSRTSASGVEMGLATIDLCARRLAYFTNLTAFARGSMANDLTKTADGTIYVTDFLGGQVLVVQGQNSASPAVSKLLDLPGANGIEHVSDALLISSATHGYLYRYDLTPGGWHHPAGGGGITGRVVLTYAPHLTPSALYGDGILFDSTRTTLYVTNAGGDYAGQVSLLRSSDGWASAKVVANVATGCGAKAPQTASVLVDGDLYTYCASGFGARPYTVRRIADVSSYAPQIPSKSLPVSSDDIDYVIILVPIAFVVLLALLCCTNVIDKRRAKTKQIEKDLSNKLKLAVVIPAPNHATSVAATI